MILKSTLKGILFFYLCFCLFFDLSAQNYFSNWYFGNGAALNFQEGKPVFLKTSELYTDEGCSSVSDENGNLLFYTNGINIWNNHHNEVLYTDYLKGDKSSAQSPVIVSVTKNEYYIFTLDQKGGPNGLNYSIIKLEALKKSNEPAKMKSSAYLTPDLLKEKTNISFIEKNKYILGPATEKLIAIPHKNGKDVWIVGHLWESGDFYALLLSKAGIVNKVFSKIGAIHNNNFNTNSNEAIGCLKASHDGTLIASSISYRPNAPVELFNFNAETGKLSNLKKIELKGEPYGLEFSPDNSKLYVSFLKGKSTLMQYEVNASNIGASGIEIFSNQNVEIMYGALQLGPDNKIYVAKTLNAIDVISDPNQKGMLCGYKFSGVNLFDKNCVYGLPSKPVILHSEEKVPETKIPPPKKEETAVQTSKETSTSKNKLKSNCTITLQDTTVKCITELTLKAGGENVEYLWSTKEKTPEIVVKSSDYYGVTLKGNGCEQKKKVYVKFESKPTNFNYLADFNPKMAMNNYFAYSINDVSAFKLIVKTKSGKVIFSTTDPKTKWDGKNEKGKLVSPDTYEWEVNYTPICTQKAETKKGKVRILEK